MAANVTVGHDVNADSTWRPPTHGPSKLLWFMTVDEFEQLQQGDISLDTVESRIEQREHEQRPLTDFSGGGL